MSLFSSVPFQLRAAVDLYVAHHVSPFDDAVSRELERLNLELSVSDNVEAKMEADEYVKNKGAEQNGTAKVRTETILKHFLRWDDSSSNGLTVF